MVTRLYSHMIRRDCLPSTMRDQESDWELVSGLVVAQ